MRKIVITFINFFSKKIIDKYKPVVIGVTGSVGKSSTCQVIAEILSIKYSIRMNNSSYRTDLSIPLAVIGADSGKHSFLGWIKIFLRACGLILKRSSFYPDILILEMGVDRPGDMKEMLKVVSPNIAVMTSIGDFPSHAEYFKDEKSVIREKATLLKSLNKKDLAIFNTDDKEISKIIKGVRAKKISFGFNSSSSVKGEEIFSAQKKWKIESGKIGMVFKISHNGTTVPFRFYYALGRGQIYAALAGTAVALHFGFNMVEISEALSGHMSLPGRMSLVKGVNGCMIIDDTFNSNPTSFLVGLESLEKLEAKRKIIVLGDMRELGKNSDKAYEVISKKVSKIADLVYCLKDDRKDFSDFLIEGGIDGDRVKVFKKKKDLIQDIIKELREGDAVFVKGARVNGMESVVKGIMLEKDLAGEILIS